MPSSTDPLQSLSIPSQASMEGCVFWTQFSEPTWQVLVPIEHTPGIPVVQAPPPPGLFSSTRPSQLLSTLSHTSLLRGETPGSASLQSRSDGDPSKSRSRIALAHTPADRAEFLSGLP